MNTEILVVGAGATGLTAAVALAQWGRKVVLIDNQPEAANTSRAAVVHARTLEVLQKLGVADDLVSRGIKSPLFTIRDRDRVLVPVRFDALPSSFPFSLMVSQAVTESVLLARLQSLGGAVLRPRSLKSLRQDPDGVSALLDDGSEVRAAYVVGADGMHSTVREAVGIAFDGGSYAESFALADVHLSADLSADEVILYFSGAGMMVLAPLPGEVFRIVAPVESAPPIPDVAFVQHLLDTRGPKARRAKVLDVIWGSRFHVHHRIANTYRDRRVLLAGDAAHVHSPAGGQGMNAGIQDAKFLADAIHAALASGPSALEAYEATRRPVAQKIIALADGLTRMATAPRGLRTLRNLVLSLLSKIPAFRRKLAMNISGLAFR